MSYRNKRRDQNRLDQGESAWFLRQQETIDKRAFMRRFPALIARQIIPTFESVSQYSTVYTWREFNPTGAAKFIKNATDDLPSVDVTGKEFSQLIKDCGNSYQYTLKEIKMGASTDVPLDAMRAEIARMGTEQLIDTTLALGSAPEGLFGILNYDSTNLPVNSRVGTFTAGTKAAGGLLWGTLAAPRATGQEMANDVIGLASQVVVDTKGIWNQVEVVMPIDLYNLAASTRLNAINDTTALEFMLKSGFVASVRPWYLCTGAGAGATNRIAAFPSDPMVLGGLVPMEWTPQAPQLRNLAYVVPCMASCGGIVVRYPIACRYMDGC